MRITNLWVRVLLWGVGILGAVVALGYGLPLALPFLVGLAVALAAEPLTRLMAKKLPRALAAGIAITGVYGLVCLLLWFLGRAALLELNRLTEQLPRLAQNAQETLSRAEAWLYRLAENAPQSLRG